MQATTAINHQLTFESTVVDVFGEARSFTLTADKLRERLATRIYDTPQWRRVPARVRDYIHGYVTASYATLYRYELEWRMHWRGNLCTAAQIPEGTWHEINSDLSRHVWRRNPERLF